MEKAPAPPLFPYTTLFRSCAVAEPAEALAAGAAGLGERAGRVEGQAALRGRDGRHGQGGDQGRRRADADPAEDRKSTRLNSSHMSISYAVFCLKKKNKGHA